MPLKLTIITPSFNQGRFLEETLLSVFNQGYEQLEYIVIDGGSTDDSVSIIRRYEDRLAYWVSEKDRGPDLTCGVTRVKLNCASPSICE